jgi:NAD(P) transhydrogenase subunit alpha
MVQQMKEGAVIVDLAVETGGNTEGVSLDQVVKSHGVSIVGFSHLSNEVAIDASQMAASNYANFLTHFWNKDEKCLHLDPEDEIIQSASLTKNGSIIHPNIQGFIQHEDENENLNDENENLNDENENDNENINKSGEQTCLTK